MEAEEQQQQQQREAQQPMSGGVATTPQPPKPKKSSIREASMGQAIPATAAHRDTTMATAVETESTRAKQDDQPEAAAAPAVTGKDELNLPLPPLHLDFSVKGDALTRPLTWQRYHRLGTLQDASAAVIGKGGFGTAYRFNRDDSFTPPESLASTNQSGDQPGMSARIGRRHMHHRSDEVEPSMLLQQKQQQQRNDSSHHHHQQHQQQQQQQQRGTDEVSSLRRVAIIKTLEEGATFASSSSSSSSSCFSGSKNHSTRSAPASPLLPAHKFGPIGLTRSPSGGSAGGAISSSSAGRLINASQTKCPRAPAVLVVKVCRTPTTGSYDELPKTGFGRHEAKAAAQELAVGNPIGQHTRIVRGEARLLRYLQLMHGLEHKASGQFRPRLPIVKLLADLPHGDYDDGKTGPPVPRLLVFERLVDLDAELTPQGWARSKQLWSVKKVESVCKDVICGLKFLHEHHVAHGDLKPSNFMRDAKTGQVKLIDLGASRRWVRLHNAEKERTSAVEELDDAVREGVIGPQRAGSIVCEGLGSLTGSPHFMAPEVLLQAGRYLAADGIARNLLDDYFVDKSRLPPVPSARLFDAAMDEFRRGWGTKADVWSWGCSVISLLLRTLPKDERPNYSTACPFDFSFEVNCDALEPMWEMHESNATLPRFHQWARIYPLRIMDTVCQGVKLPHYVAMLSPPLREALQACFLLQLPRPSSSDICAFFEQVAFLSPPTMDNTAQVSLIDARRQESTSQSEALPQQPTQAYFEHRAASPATLSPTIHSQHLLASSRHPSTASYASHPDSIHNIDLPSSGGNSIADHPQAPVMGLSGSVILQQPPQRAPAHPLYKRPGQSQSQVSLSSTASRQGPLPPSLDPTARHAGRSPLVTATSAPLSPISMPLPIGTVGGTQQQEEAPMSDSRKSPEMKQILTNPYEDGDGEGLPQTGDERRAAISQTAAKSLFETDDSLGSPSSPVQGKTEGAVVETKQYGDRKDAQEQSSQEPPQVPSKSIDLSSTQFLRKAEIQNGRDDDKISKADVKERDFAKEERATEPTLEQSKREKQHCDVNLHGGETVYTPPKREPPRKKSTTLFKSFLPFHRSSEHHPLPHFPAPTPWRHHQDAVEVEMHDAVLCSMPRQVMTKDAELSSAGETSDASAQGHVLGYSHTTEDHDGRLGYKESNVIVPPPPILFPPHKRMQKERIPSHACAALDNPLPSESEMAMEQEVLEPKPETPTSGGFGTRSFGKPRTLPRRSQTHQTSAHTSDHSEGHAPPPSAFHNKRSNRLRMSRSFASIHEAAQQAGHFISSALGPARHGRPSTSSSKASSPGATGSKMSQMASPTREKDSDVFVVAGTTKEAVELAHSDANEAPKVISKSLTDEETSRPVQEARRIEVETTPVTVVTETLRNMPASHERQVRTPSSTTREKHTHRTEKDGKGANGSSTTSSSPISASSAPSGGGSTLRSKGFGFGLFRGGHHHRKAT